MKKRINIFLSFVLLLAYFGVASFAADNRIPDYYDELGEDAGREYISQLPTVNVDPFSGKLRMNHVDIRVPLNGGSSFEVIRSYSARDNHIFVKSDRSLLGVGWLLHFGRIIGKNNSVTCVDTDSSNASDNHVLELPDGSRKTFFRPSQGRLVVGSSTRYITKDRWIATCNTYASPFELTVKSPDGTQRVFKKAIYAGGVRTDYYITEMEDAHGNKITFNYHGDGKPFSPYNSYPLIKKIVTPSGTIYFNYSGLIEDSSKVDFIQLTSIRFQGETWTYSKNSTASTGWKLLDSVRRPDGSKWYFHYHTSSLVDAGKWSIKSVQSPYGAKTHYAYQYKELAPGDVSTVIYRVKRDADTARGTPGGTWNYNYYPGYNSYLTGALDYTWVKGPDKKEVYWHYGYQALSSGTYSGQLWRMGLLDKKRICAKGSTSICSSRTAIQREEYSWTSQTISNEDVNGPRRFSASSVKVPLLTKKSTFRNDDEFYTEYSNFSPYGVAKTVKQGEKGGEIRTIKRTTYDNLDTWVIGVVSDETFQDVWGEADFKIDRSFYSHGKLKSEKHLEKLKLKPPLESTTSYTYYSNGNLHTVQDALGKVTTYSEYRLGIPQTIKREEGVTETQVVNADGTIASKTNGRGYTFAYGYDDLYRLNSIDYPEGENVSITWNISRYVLNGSTLTRGGLREERKYSGLGLLVWLQRTDISSMEGMETITIKYRYDSEGRRIFESLPNSSNGFNYSYDELGRLERKTFADSSFIEYQYLSGNRVKVIDRRKNATTHTYRSWGDPAERELITIEAPEKITTSIERDKLDNIRSISQGSSTRTYHYNNMLQFTGSTDPETERTTLEVDLVGNIKSRQVGASGITRYYYDDLHRLDYIDYPGETGTHNVDYVYYADSKVENVTHGDIARDFSYDNNGNRKQTDLTISSLTPAVTYSISYLYDDLDYLASTTYPSGRVVDYAPDAFGQPHQAGEFVTSANYHPSGLVESITYGNGVKTKYAINGQRHLIDGIAVEHISTANVLVDLAYGYDSSGNLESIEETVPTEYLWSLSYDAVNRLSSADNVEGRLGYQYDLTGNILSIQRDDTEIQGYLYDAKKYRLASLSGRVSGDYLYDAYGNIQQAPNGTFTYNAAGNLIEGSAGGNPHYQYDAGGFMATKSVGGAISHYFYSSQGQLMHEVSLGGASKDYIYLGTQLVATAENGLASSSQSNGGK
ncbi:MAG: hypothetical protein ABW168_04740 [Sedimenticola sp.]